MKKFLCMVLIVAMMTGTIGAGAVESISQEEHLNVPEFETTTIITDRDEIKEVVTAYGLEENVDDIEEIVICDIDASIYESNENGVQPLLGTDYKFEKIKTEDAVGNLLKSDTYSYPGAVSSVSYTMKRKIVESLGISDDIISAKLEISFEESITFTASQNVEVTKEQGSRTCNAYAKLQRDTYHVIEQDLFFDDDLGNVVIDTPVGVIFVVFNRDMTELPGKPN